jgi:hypothetical protein
MFLQRSDWILKHVEKVNPHDILSRIIHGSYSSNVLQEVVGMHAGTFRSHYVRESTMCWNTLEGPGNDANYAVAMYLNMDAKMEPITTIRLYDLSVLLLLLLLLLL